MTKTIFYTGLVLYILFLASCHKENDDYTTDVIIEMEASDSICIERMQGTVTLTNLSNGQRYSVSTFNGARTETEVFRGPYSVQAEGTLQYRRASSSEVVTCKFRGNSSYEEALTHPAHIKLELLLLKDL